MKRVNNNSSAQASLFGEKIEKGVSSADLIGGSSKESPETPSAPHPTDSRVEESTSKIQNQISTSSSNLDLNHDDFSGESEDAGREGVSSFGKITPEFTVSEATALFNQIFETATPTITVIGEVANFKVNQGKWVFFDIKDSESSLGCFMSVFNLHVAVEDGMKVAIVARPQITKWGKFSLTVQQIRPVGEGAIKRAFELLREKLNKEGLFAPERKRLLPELPQRIGVISSVDAAGYKDFVKILSSRMGGMSITVAPVQVQGDIAAEQIIGALRYFNEMSELPEVICLLRGGGSRDDLMAFDDEKLVREIAASRVPIITGVGHEIDTTLADLAADVRASTPSNAAEILVPNKREIIAEIDMKFSGIFSGMRAKLDAAENEITDGFEQIKRTAENLISEIGDRLKLLNDSLQHLNPREVLRRGYAIVRAENGEILREKPRIDAELSIENSEYIIKTAVRSVRENKAL